MWKKPKPKDEKPNFEERRQYKRVNKNFILTYFEKTNPQKKYEITQLKNISLGGMCFVTDKSFPLNVTLGVQLKTPFIAENTYLEGFVVGSHEKVKDMIYETRLKFENLEPHAGFILSKLIDFFVNGENPDNE